MGLTRWSSLVPLLALWVIAGTLWGAIGIARADVPKFARKNHPT